MSPQIQQLARQQIAERHEVARRQSLAEHAPARLPRARAYARCRLVALGTRLAPTRPSASNRVTIER